MEDEEKRKQIISGIPEIKEEDYRNIQNQNPKIDLSQILDNTAYNAIKNYYIQIFGQNDNVLIDPVINLTRIDALRKDIQNYLPLSYAGTLILNVLSLFSKREQLDKDYLHSFDQIHYKDETSVGVSYRSFKKVVEDPRDRDFDDKR